MKNQNNAIDYYGAMQLLRQLLQRRSCTKKEAAKIADRLAVQYSVDFFISL
ncbi:hypothetical protein [Oscillibacter sp.]|uniref:hypothetical protein n=1 Tax=Oscillibacter sp. TaxID=1945593 RepID=UPI0028A73F70|nr:hypothetical protein [Oscillibacter sp.]